MGRDLTPSAGDDVISLAGLDSLQITMALSAADVAGVRLGQAATVSVSELRHEQLAAHVIAIDSKPTAVGNSTSYEVTYALDDRAARVKPGMTAAAQPMERLDTVQQLEERLRARLAAEQEVTLQAHEGLVGIATRYLGVPYVWGGASPTAGFDCSGLVKFVYAQVGVSLPHYAASQFNYGIPVLRDELEPGDLVFFNGLHHVGMYVGNDEFIQAPHTGDVVKISSLDEPWYATTYAGARRLESSPRLLASASARTLAGIRRVS
jgi:cell wall-associated NlpC family hydrolase